MKLLIDTNVFIPMEPTSVQEAEPGEEAVLLARLCQETSSQLFVHPDAIFDIRRDGNHVRRSLREVQFRKYPSLPQPPAPTEADEHLLGCPAEHSNDWVDNRLLVALKANCADFLVSNDAEVYRKAKRMAIEDRVLTRSDAAEMLQSLAGHTPQPPPSVTHLFAHNLHSGAPIFGSFREDYPDFDHWLDKCRTEHRKAWIIPGTEHDYAGVCIVKDESDDSYDGRRQLKICSFKVSEGYAGFRFGELLLKTVFDYARENRFQRLHVTVFDKYAPLVQLMEGFGFCRKDELTLLGELILEKSMLTSDRIGEGDQGDIGYNVTHGPYVVEWARNRVFFVPIKPEYHAMLFPEAERQLALFDSRAAYGNSIRKAYLCNASTRQMKRGDVLVFYRSTDERGVTALGVLEDCLVSADPARIAAFVGNRTVYTQGEIAFLARSGLLALLFRHVRNLAAPLSLAELVKGRALGSAPQSIQQVRNGGYKWIRDRLMAR